jgi:hypothetical protein
VLPALALSLFALAAPRLGAQLTFADLRPGAPSANDMLQAAWSDNGGAVAIVLREKMGQRQLVRIRVRADGTPDAGSNLELRVPVGSGAVFARAGRGILGVWYDRLTDAMYASRVDTTGILEVSNARVLAQGFQYTSTPICDESRCLVSVGAGILLLDFDGTPRGTLPGGFSVVAGRHEFLVTRCGLAADCRIELFDDTGAVKSSRPGRLEQAMFDGTRFVEMSRGPQGEIIARTIDAATGAPSAPIRLATLPEAEHLNLAWNGSVYALSMTIRPRFPFPCACDTTPWTATMRFDRDLAPFDREPRKLTDTDSYDTPSVVGVDGGFIVFSRGLDADARQRIRVLHNDGTLTPTPGAGTLLFDDGLVSQFAATAAASPDAILGVWVEMPGDGMHLRAARVTRDGTRIDRVPLEISSARILGNVVAASDGSSFAVAWVEVDNPATDGRLVIAVIDPSGNMRKGVVDPFIRAWRTPTVTFANGAFQLALPMDFGVEAVTFTASGEVLRRERISAPVAGNCVASFDGRRLIAIWDWYDNHTLTELVKDFPGPAAEIRNLISAGRIGNFTLEHDAGDGYLLLLNAYGTAGDASYAVPLSARGELIGEPFAHPVGLGRFYGLSLVRAGAEWIASWTDSDTRSVAVVIDGMTLQAGPRLPLPLGPEYAARVVAGWKDAILIANIAVPDKHLPAGQAAAQVLSPPSRGRAARH